MSASDEKPNRWQWLLLPLSLGVVAFLWYAWIQWGAIWYTQKAMTAASAHAGVSKAAVSSVPPAAVELTIAQLGQGGDMFGGLNALFAGFAFAGVGVAAYFQKKAMDTQRTELEITKDQQQRNAFEPLFFQLLQLHLAEEKRLELRGPDGWDWLNSMSMTLDESVRNMLPFNEALHALRLYSENWATPWDERAADDVLRKSFSGIYLELYKVNENTLGPYFRTLYHLLKLIHTSELGEQEEIKYSNIVRAQLGRDTLLVIMLNCLTAYGRGLRPYVEKYGLLKHINSNIVNDPTIDERLATLGFSKSARMSLKQRLEYWKINRRPQFVDD